MKIIRPPQFAEKQKRLWEKGLPPGDKTGWPDVDQYYSVAPGMLTILTGYPGSGKSEWLDALLLNLSKQGWKFLLYSPENLPHELHVAKWLEKLWNKPFGDGPTERMSLDEVQEGLDELGQHFAFIAPNPEESVSMPSILENASTYFDDDFTDCKHGLIVDPWNELEHLRPRDISETEYISYTLGMVRAWARARRIHVWIVAHPQKLKRLDGGNLPIPTPDSISGSVHWWNKADCSITVHRDLADPRNPNIDIYVQKVRFKHIGKVGKATLRYMRLTGRYESIAPKNFTTVRDD